jgi:hypothetical protein
MLTVSASLGSILLPFQSRIVGFQLVVDIWAHLIVFNKSIQTILQVKAGLKQLKT